MAGFLARLKTVIAGKPPVVAPVYYQVDCRCGGELRGERLASAQTVVCPSCGAAQFIFPRSPFPKSTVVSSAVRPSWRWRLWAVPAMAVFTTALILVLAYRWLFPTQHNSPNGNSPPVNELLIRAQKEFNDGNIRVAFESFAKIYSSRAADVEKLPAAERRQWQQASREAALYADLLSEDLAEIVQQAFDISGRASEEEWQAVFRQRYKGKSVLWDVTLHRGGDSLLHIPAAFTTIQVGKLRARLAIQELKLLQELKLNQRSRVLFGARLAACHLEDGVWLVQFVEDSGVLLTHEKAAINQCRTWTDDDSRQILKAQAKELREAP